jgi:1,4-alpha-glucan branching enzyme
MSSDFDPKSVLEIDPWLVDNVGAIGHRYQLFKKWKDTIKQTDGGYDQFTKGYLKFGLNVRPDGSVVYREWAPNAKEAVLIGDFSARIQHLTMSRKSPNYIR